MTIVAKYSTTCPNCNAQIAVGSKVEWSRGTKAVHVSCPTGGATAATTARVASSPRASTYASTYRRSVASWTGCSCGSREDNPRESDCASCQHDY